jgi:hypothetical protein
MAFLVSSALFGYFWVVGFAVLDLLYRRDDRVRTMLIAPAAGLVITLYGNYIFSRSGLSIGAIATPFAIVLFVAAVGILGWRRPLLPGRSGVHYFLIMAASLVASGWPLFELGFDWLAHFNPDAGNYILDAHRLFRRPFIEVPDAGEFLRQSDWSSQYIYFPAIGARVGTDLVFAWVVAVSGLDETSAYMPLLVALHVAATSAATALIGPAYRSARLLSGALLAVCALSSVGVALQLLGQEQGLACLILSCVLLLTPFYRLSRGSLARHIFLSGLAGAGFLLSYPELLPFLGLSFLIYHGIGIKEFRQYWRSALIACVAVGALVSALVAPDVLGLLRYLFSQASAGAASQRHPELFPYLLIPNGVAAVWGLRTYAPGGPSLIAPNIAIALGFLLSIFAIFGAGWMTLRREACGTVLTVMGILSAILLFDEAGFGVFKLAMYAQPFLVGTFVLSLCRVLKVAR